MENIYSQNKEKLERLIRKINVALILKKDLDLICSVRYRSNNSTEVRRSGIKSFKDNILELEDSSVIYINNLIDLTYCS